MQLNGVLAARKWRTHETLVSNKYSEGLYRHQEKIINHAEEGLKCAAIGT